jgi:hypothetical protein
MIAFAGLVLAALNRLNRRHHRAAAGTQVCTRLR